MKQLIQIFMFLFVTFAIGQDTTKVSTANEDISENLDLRAVASLFAEAESLEEFEEMLNDPETQLSNLDLNEDGEVDYLRVMETKQGTTHYIAIQAVLGDDLYQDVATIEVELKEEGKEEIQVVGDTYIYGDTYIIEPVYPTPPPIYVYWWRPTYVVWRSPWYWGYRPPYYRPWRPVPVHYYHRNVNVRVNVNVHYNKTTVRKSSTSVSIHSNQRRNDYGRQYPNKSYNNRPTSPANRPAQPQQLPANSNRATTPNKSTGKPVNSNWQPSSSTSPNYNNNRQPSTNQNYNSNRQPATNNNRQPSPTPNTTKQPSTTRQPSATPRTGGNGGGKSRR